MGEEFIRQPGPDEIGAITEMPRIKQPLLSERKVVTV
jgi:hypothetical protein